MTQRRPILIVFVDAILSHRALVAAIVTLLTGGLLWAASTLPLVTAIGDYIPKDTRGYAEWQQARARFGGDEIALFALNANEALSPEGLSRLEALHARIEGHALVDDVLSPVDAQQIRVDPEAPDTLLIEPFFREGDDGETLRTRMLADDTLGGALISDDGALIFIAVQLVPSHPEVLDRDDVEEAMTYYAQRIPGAELAKSRPLSLLDMCKQAFTLDLITWFEEAGFERRQVHAVGFAVFVASMVQDTRRNLETLLPLTTLIIGLMLFLIFRRLIDAIIPIVCILPAVVWSTAVGGLFFGRLTVFTSLAPIMVLVVGVSDVVHLVTQFRHEIRRGAERREAIRLAYQNVGAACVLTSVTTFIGFGAMVLLPVPQSQELGVFASLGVVMAFVLSFTLTPILLSIAPVDVDTREQSPRLARALLATAHAVRPRPWLIATLGLLATVGTAITIPSIRVENTFAKKLGPNHPARKALDIITASAGSSGEFEVLIDSHTPDGIKSPELIQSLHALQTRMNADPRMVHTLSIADVLIELKAKLAPERAAAEPLPQSRAEIAQYLLLFEASGGEDLHRILDDTGQHARILVRGVAESAESANVLMDDIIAWSDEVFDDDVSVEPNGIGVLAARLAPPLFSSSIQGFVTALSLIAVLMAVLFRSWRVGVVSLVPNILPVNLGLLIVWLTMAQVDADTLAFIAICIGIAVDDTIHFLARYRIERQAGRDRNDAVQHTILEAGYGIARTSLILVAGFIVLVVADYQPIRTMGVMLPITLIAALVLDLTLVPAMAQLGWLEPGAAGQAGGGTDRT